MQSLGFKVTTPNSDVNYFKLNLDAKWYFPLSRDQRWSFLTRFEFGYGNGYGSYRGNDQLLPFWENFRAGGADTLRGFETNIIGPRPIYRSATAIPNPSDPLGSGAICCLGPDHDRIESTQNLRAVGGNAKKF